MKTSKHSLWLHFGLSASIVIVTLLSVAWYATDRFQGFFIHHLEDVLESRAITVRQTINKQGINHSNVNKNYCQVLQISDPNIRVTIVNHRGVVQCDSEADPATMKNHAQRPEVLAAMAGERGAITRFSETVKTTMLYLAIPWVESGKVIGVIRMAVSLSSINTLLEELYDQFTLLLIVLMLVISFAVIITYRKINRPLAEITRKASQYAHGDFGDTLPEYDIREISELGIALNRMANQLDRLENLRKDFVANVSHELKTPIATIKSYVETLLDGAQHSPKDLERFLNIVLKQNDRLSAIVDDLLTLSRLESAPINQILDLHENDACELLNASVDICQTLADAKKITLKVNCLQSISVRVDRSLMTQALVNLLDNAIKYSNDNTVITLSAETKSVETKNNQVLLSVCDQGPGIPDEHIPRLFERFYRVDKSRSRRVGGTGLGLAIVKHIVHIHDGQVNVSKNDAVGSCFCITLPVSPTSHAFLTQS